jgi:hypothetical protein
VTRAGEGVAVVEAAYAVAELATETFAREAAMEQDITNLHIKGAEHRVLWWSGRH